VPFGLAGTGIAADEFRTYDERSMVHSRLVFEEGWRLMGYFLGS
jgi:hypothetical protein